MGRQGRHDWWGQHKVRPAQGQHLEGQGRLEGKGK